MPKPAGQADAGCARITSSPVSPAPTEAPSASTTSAPVPGTGPATAHIPIIALSANAVPRDIEYALEAGFFNYVTKPIQVIQFMEALDAALDFAQTSAPTTAARAAAKEPA